MTLGDLISGFRNLAFDLKTPYLFPDALLAIYANEAQVEACLRARLIIDSTTVAAGYPTASDTALPICQYSVTAGMASIALDPRVIFVRRVKIASKELPIPKIRREDLDMAAPGWEDAEPSDVVTYMTNYQHGAIFFHTAFPADDTLRLTVVREPLYPIDSDTEPEIAPRYQMKLIDWMLYRALTNRDVEEKYDPEGAAQHLARFEAVFGGPVSARDDIWIAERYGYDDYEGVF
jgi:hypothetical protein